MPKFKPIGRSAVNVIARLAAQNIIKEQLRDQGVRLTLVPIREIANTRQNWSRLRRTLSWPPAAQPSVPYCRRPALCQSCS